MMLRQFLEQYIADRDISDGYSNQLKWFLRSLERHAGRPLDVADWSRDLLNAYLKSTRDRLSQETRRSRRRMALTIWQAAADEGLVSEPPRRKIMRIKAPDKLHRAWAVDDVKLLVNACDGLVGTNAGIPRRLYWRSYVLAAWDTGLRGCDLRRIRRDQIADTGTIVIIQAKTGRKIACRVRPETLDAIRATFPPQRGLVWPLWGRLELWRRQAAKLVKAAGLTGSIGRLRHSSGTSVEILCPGRGHEHLGNSRSVFERHYLDHRLVEPNRPMPAKLI